MTPEQQTGKIYTAFPEAHYKRKVPFDVSQADPGGAMVEAKLDFDPDVEIINGKSFAFDVKFIITSDLFEIVLHLYQRVDFYKPFNIGESLRRKPDTFKGVMLQALPHAAQIINQFILNMGMKSKLEDVTEQLKNCIKSLKKKKQTIH